MFQSIIKYNIFCERRSSLTKEMDGNGWEGGREGGRKEDRTAT